MNNQSITKFKTVIQFHGILLTVISYDGEDYIPLKPIIEMMGTQWKTARETAFSGDNCQLYGTCELNEPVFNSFSTLKGTKKTVFILLEAGEIYLARVNTSRLKANGNKSSAEQLLILQKEWRKALHDYETKGIAYKNKTAADLKTYTELRNKTTISEERECYTQLIKHCFIELGVDAGKEEQSSAQQSLDV